ncbi:P-type conjugative transfer protein TrbL [Morganella morganii]
MQKAAKYLLFTLGIIALVLKMVPLVLKGADLGEIIKELIIFVLIIGIWLAFIINAKEWTDAIINSFMKLAQLANQTSMQATPVGILKQGFIVVGKVFTDPINPITLLTQVICALIIMIIYAKIAFYLLKVMLETYIVSYGGIILLGFGGIAFTSDYAKRYFTYVISCGIKLFMTLLIIGFGGNFIASFLTLNFTEFANCVAIVAVVVMLMMLAEGIPDMAQSMMVTGASLGNSNMNIGGSLATMAAAAAAFTAACYAGAAAFKAAGAANAAGGGGAATGGLSGGDLANALSKGGGSGVAGGGGSGGSSSLPNGG